MKKILFVNLLFLACLFTAAQNVPYNVVFDLTSNNPTDQEKVLRWMKLISADHPDAKMQVVLYGQSLNMVTKNSPMEKEVQQLAENKNIGFVVCEASMRRHKIETDKLIQGVKTVPDGIYEIIKKQKEGWGYIKATD